MKEGLLVGDAYSIAEVMYEIADEIEVKLPDEKWRTASKLKNAANDVYFYVAQVEGAGKGQSLEYDCISAKKYLSALRSMYIFASKQKMTDLDPGLIVNIDKLMAKIDTEQEAVKTDVKRRVEEELKPWLEKYHIWQKISKR